ncbi:MAG: Ig-like domain-containing protein [Burkholderiales bacterium]|nr:MAG: Ig-like domain-containing protein [Burkholderiales bacterium]
MGCSAGLNLFGCGRFVRLAALLAGAAIVAACGDQAPGGGTGGGTSTPITAASIEMSTSRSSIAARAGEAVDVTVTALDSSRRAVADVPVTMSADSGVLTSASGTTDASGKLVAKFELGQDRSNRTVTIKATAGELSSSATIQVTGTTLTLTSNASSVSGPSATAKLSARLIDAASEPISGAAIVFSTDQGTLSATTAATDASGTATVEISGITTEANIVAESGSTVGSVTIRASGQGQVTLLPEGVVIRDFIVQANPAVTGPNQPGNTGNFSSIDVRVFGALGVTENVQVGNAAVRFRIATSPPYGVLDVDTSVNPALSNSTGLATNRFVPGGATSGTDAIVICASVDGLAVPATPGLDFAGNPCQANEKPVRLTVAQQALFVKISTDNQIEKTDGGLTYTKKFTVNVTDAAGRGVPGVVVTPRLLPVYYYKGYYTLGEEQWSKAANLRCDNEDSNFNGILDSQDNNENGDAFVWPGQAAAVSVANNGVTDGTGFVILSLKYGQRFGTWATYQIEARASVGGTEGVAQFEYGLDVATPDVKNKEATPGFQTSPYGVGTSCSDPR